MKAHKGVSRDTIGGWIRDKTKLTGIDVSKLSPHLRRAASTRSAHNEGVPIDNCYGESWLVKYQYFSKVSL